MGPPLGRDAEVGQVEHFLDGVVDGSRALLFEGEVGIGKTTLIEHARAQASARGYALLAAKPVEAEMPLEFASLADLFEDVPPPLVDALPAPQRLALEAAVLRHELSEVPVDPRTIATATLHVLRSLSTIHPVVVVVDDLPWLDVPTARVVSFVLRRAGTAPVGLLAAARTNWPGTPPLVALDNLGRGQVEHLKMGPLSLGALRALLASSVGLTLGRSELLRLHELSGGNPLFALELAAVPGSALRDRAGGATPLPSSLRRLVLDRTTALSAAERDILLVSALTSEASLAVVMAAASDPTNAGDDLDGAIRAGLLDLAADRVSFTHPLFRSVVVGDARPVDRRSVHRRLAAVLERPEARARHLALASVGPDETVAEDVEEAARLAAARGACDTAADLVELTVTLTPQALAEHRHDRLVLEAEYRFEASDPAKACALLEGVIDDIEKGPFRAELLRRMARYRGYLEGPFGTWAATLTAALEECGDDDAFRASVLHDLGLVASNRGDLVGAARYGMSALDLAERSGDHHMEAQLCAGLAFVGFVAGKGLAQDMVRRALDGPEQPARLPMELRPNYVLGHIFCLSDDLDNARSCFEREYVRAKEEGVETALPLVLAGLVQTEAYAGNWERAEQLANEGYEIAEDSNSLMAIAFAATSRSLILCYRGRLEDGRRDRQRATELAEAVGQPLLVLLASQSTGPDYLSVGDARRTHEHLAPLAEGVRAVGVTEPALVRFLPDEVEALVRLGELDAAAELLGPFEERSAELGRDWGIATAGRCRALLLAARGKLDDAEVALADALEAHSRMALPFEEARTLLVAGEVHRRARRRGLANRQLQAALTIFERLGAPLWARRTGDELDRLGLRRTPAGPGLTSSERRVADLAASGLTNAQIAAQLFMAQRTVEAHLSRVYSKLGVHSRTEMSRVHLGPWPDLE